MKNRIEGLNLPFYFAFFIFTFFLVIGYRYGYLYGIVDSPFQELNLNVQSANIPSLLSWWGFSRGAGELQSVFSPEIVQFIYLKGIGFFTNDFYTLNFLKIFILNILFFISTYLALSSFKFYEKRGIGTQTILSVVSLLSVFNLYFLQSNQTILFPQRFDYIIFCLFVYLLNKYIERPEVLKTKLSLLTLFVVANGTWDLFPYWIPYFFVLGLYTVYLFFKKKLNLREFGLIWGFYLILNAPSLLSLLYYIKNLNYGLSMEASYANQVFKYANVNSTLPDVFSFIGGVNWGLTWSWINSLVFPYYQIFTSSSSLILARFIPVGLLFFLIFWKKKKDLFDIGAIAVLCIFVFFITANNLPFGALYSHEFYANNLASLFFRLYREPHNKFYPLFIFLISLLITKGIFETSRRIRIALTLILGFYLLVFAMVVGIFTFYSQSAFFMLPPAYVDVAKDLDQSSLVLVLPSYQEIQSYSFNHYGTSPLQFTLSNPTLIPYTILESKYNNLIAKKTLGDFNFQEANSALNWGSLNPTFNPQSLSGTNINYIILDGYVTGAPTFTRLDFEYLKGQIDSLQGFKFMDQQGELYLYQREEMTPLIFASSTKTTYRQINDYEYLVQIENLSSPQLLVFLQSFDSGWQVYLNHANATSGCKTQTSYTSFNSIQCVSEDNPDISSSLEYMLKKSLSPNQHSVWDGYANSWNMDPTYLKALGKEYYQTNSDGSINISLIIYFKPQSYYYLSIVLMLLAYFCGVLLTFFPYFIFNRLFSRTKYDANSLPLRG